jgi:hypothetical protein
VSFTLLRVGLTWGIGSKAHSSGRFTKNWGLLPLKDISALLLDLQNKLKIQPYGVGDVLVALLGRSKAEELAISENVVIRIDSTSKRPMEHDGPNDEPSSKKHRVEYPDSDM